METDGDRVGVNIWIDRDPDGKIDHKTLVIAREFKRTWKRGRACVHKQTRNASIMGQWFHTWRPHENTKELALILEDDIDLSPFAWHWIKSAHEHYGSWPDIAGYSMQMENVNIVRGNYTPLIVPKTERSFLYIIFGTWGWAPKPEHWRKFQDWLAVVRRNSTFKPYIKNTELHLWYFCLEKSGKQDTMSEMWLQYYYYHHNLFSLFPNLQQYANRKDVLLNTNRREDGLHYGGGWTVDNSSWLMPEWDPDFVKFPNEIRRYAMNGSMIDIMELQ
jgi:hypothetical protein